MVKEYIERVVTQEHMEIFKKLFYKHLYKTKTFKYNYSIKVRNKINKKNYIKLENETKFFSDKKQETHFFNKFNTDENVFDIFMENRENYKKNITKNFLKNKEKELIDFKDNKKLKKNQIFYTRFVKKSKRKYEYTNNEKYKELRKSQMYEDMVLSSLLYPNYDFDKFKFKSYKEEDIFNEKYKLEVSVYNYKTNISFFIKENDFRNDFFNEFNIRKETDYVYYRREIFEHLLKKVNIVRKYSENNFNIGIFLSYLKKMDNNKTLLNEVNDLRNYDEILKIRKKLPDNIIFEEKLLTNKIINRGDNYLYKAKKYEKFNKKSLLKKMLPNDLFKLIKENDVKKEFLQYFLRDFKNYNWEMELREDGYGSTIPEEVYDIYINKKNGIYKNLKNLKTKEEIVLFFKFMSLGTNEKINEYEYYKENKNVITDEMLNFYFEQESKYNYMSLSLVIAYKDLIGTKINPRNFKYLGLKQYIKNTNLFNFIIKLESYNWEESSTKKAIEMSKKGISEKDIIYKLYLNSESIPKKDSVEELILKDKIYEFALKNDLKRYMKRLIESTICKLSIDNSTISITDYKENINYLLNMKGNNIVYKTILFNNSIMTDLIYNHVIHTDFNFDKIIFDSYYEKIKVYSYYNQQFRTLINTNPTETILIQVYKNRIDLSSYFKKQMIEKYIKKHIKEIKRLKLEKPHLFF